MDSNVRREAVKKLVEKRFKGKKTLVCKSAPRYPQGVEREYIRVTNSYMRLLSKAIAEELVPEIRKAANLELAPGYWREDDANGLMQRLAVAFDKCTSHLEKQTSSFDLHHRLSQIAALTVKLNIKEWKRAVKDTLGIDLLDDYYTGEFYRQALEAWTQLNVGLIKTIPSNTLDKMRDIVMTGYQNGETTTSIIKKIQRAYSISRRRARLIARDQLGKLNADITKKQQQDAGVDEYEWSDSRDEKVRKRHHELDGKRFRWDDPPIVDQKTGRRCHPGQDYQCRCCALPVFDIDTLDL